MSGSGSFWSPVLWRSLWLGMLCAALMLAAIFLRNEIWNNRTYALVVIWLLGGLAGGFAASVAVAIAHRLLGITAARVLRMLVFLPAFIAAGAVFFSLHTRLQSDFELHPDHPVMSLVFGTSQLVGLFVYTMSHYMLPWMAPVMVLAGFALLPRPPGG